ncbi:hypothetical protein BC826DRAFT_1127072 [Russula brevipes]|nr:hypothetical protein BC826DRAFT_1127072 [Russula brevipes]
MEMPGDSEHVSKSSLDPLPKLVTAFLRRSRRRWKCQARSGGNASLAHACQAFQSWEWVDLDLWLPFVLEVNGTTVSEVVRQPNIFLPSRAPRKGLHEHERSEKYGGVCGRAPITSQMTQVAVPIRDLSSSTLVRTGVRAVPLSVKHDRIETVGQIRPRRISQICVTSIDGKQNILTRNNKSRSVEIMSHTSPYHGFGKDAKAPGTTSSSSTTFKSLVLHQAHRPSPPYIMGGRGGGAYLPKCEEAKAQQQLDSGRPRQAGSRVSAPLFGKFVTQTLTGLSQGCLASSLNFYSDFPLTEENHALSALIRALLRCPSDLDEQSISMAAAVR